MYLVAFLNFSYNFIRQFLCKLCWIFKSGRINIMINSSQLVNKMILVINIVIVSYIYTYIFSNFAYY